QERTGSSPSHGHLTSSRVRLSPKAMAQNPNHSTAFLGRRARAKEFIKKPFKKIFIKPGLFLAFTQQQQLSSSTQQSSTSFAQPTSLPHHGEPTSRSPQQLSSLYSRRRFSPTGQLIRGFFDESSSSSSLQLAYSSTQLSKSSTTQPSSQFPDQHQASPSKEQPGSISASHTAHSTEQFHTFPHHQHQAPHKFQPRLSQISFRKPSVTMSGSVSLLIEETHEFKNLPAVERANAFIKHVVFEENKELSEEKANHIKIKCDKTWAELVDLGTFNETDGTQQCQKLVRAPVIGEEICHKLWLRLANIARKGNYTNEVTNLDAARSNLLIEGKAEALRKKAAEKANKDAAKKKAKENRRASESLRLSPRPKTEPGAGKKAGEGEVPKDKAPFWQAPDPHKPKLPPPEMAVKDTPIPDGKLAQLEGDKEAIEPLLSPGRKTVVFANELATAKKEGESSRRNRGAAAGSDLEETTAKDAENKNKQKATEVKESRPKNARSRSFSGRLSSTGSRFSYGLGSGISKDLKDEKPRKKSI
ncbi:hypothetical protein QBC36DRAFT_178161, partial [Triangularia setosa]